MSTIDALGSSGGTSTAAPDAFSELSSEEFVRIMFTELSNQDPLKPNDTSAMLEQLSSLRSIQSDLELGSKLESIVAQNQLATAGALIGNYISGITAQGERVIGLVESVSRTSDGPILNLTNGYRLHFDNVDQMLAAAPQPAPAPAPAPEPADDGGE